jgi:hypothetical protein
MMLNKMKIKNQKKNFRVFRYFDGLMGALLRSSLECRLFLVYTNQVLLFWNCFFNRIVYFFNFAYVEAI